jgi:hypothetical protein
MFKNLKYIYARISLLILALGFTLLGALSLIGHAQERWAAGSNLENDYCRLGGSFSIFAGIIFLGAAWVYWRR